MTETFIAAQFTPTAHSTAADKAKFANHMVRFVKSDFKENLFYMWFYTRLSMCFGHIAHYNGNGFYGEWFSSAKRKADFLENITRYRPCGDPAHTYSDVEKALADWVRDTRLHGKYLSDWSKEVENAERGQLRRLKAKYEPS